MRWMKGMLALCSLAGFGGLAQTPNMKCNEHSAGHPGFCEIRESTMAAAPKLSVDGKTNGGIRVVGANRPDILIRAKVQGRGDSEAEAKGIASQVSIQSTGGAVSANGPEGKSWAVSYEIFVPTSTALNLTAHNGGILVDDVQGDIEFHTVNGGIHLARLAGTVRGETVNGGIHLDLTGAGRGVDVKTQNGGVHIALPNAFSGQLDLATVNGRIHVGLPNVQIEKHQRTVVTTVGSGGPLIRAHTQNGGVHIGGPAPV